MPEDRKSARQWALKALGRRMHTVQEIRSALSGRGFENDVVSDVLEELSDRGYVNDFHFAQVWIQSRSVHQLHGRLRLQKDLRQKGIPEEIVRSVLEELLPEREELAIAIRAIEKKQRTLKVTGVKGREALYRHLRSRGFTTGTINQAMAGISFEEETS